MIGLSVTIDLAAFRQEAQRETARLVADTARAVEAAGAAGKSTARILAPHRSYALRDSVDATPTVATMTGAECELVALADHASMVVDGTKAHTIEARRKRFLRFEAGGGIVFARRVSHPGTAPNPTFWERGQEAAQRVLDARCADATDSFCIRLSAA